MGTCLKVRTFSHIAAHLILGITFLAKDNHAYFPTFNVNLHLYVCYM